MFDYIKNELYCPFCKFKCKKNSYQTKDFKCRLDELDILKIRGINYNIYHQCENCHNWIDLNISNDYGNSGGIHSLEEGKKLIAKRKRKLI